MRDSTIFYRSFYEALKELPLINQGEIYNAIFEYSFNDNLVNLAGLSKTIFTLIKPQLDANNKKYQNGLKGGKRNQTETKPESNLNQNVTKSKPKANQNVTKSEANVNVNDNVNDNVNEKDNVCVNTHAPAREEFLSFCQTLDIDFDRLKETISAKYDTFVDDGWCNGYGKPITNWQNTIRNVIPHLKPMPTKIQNEQPKAKGNFGTKNKTNAK
jgi:hypothetical protein